MANRKFQGRSVSGTNDFIHIDLLPNVKRPRQFNVNILLLVLIAVFASWLVIYLPLTTRQERLDDALEDRSDLQYQLLLVNEERVGYNIEGERLVFAEALSSAESLQIDLLDYHNQIANQINSNGMIVFMHFDHNTNVFSYDVIASSNTDFVTIDFELVELPFITSSSYTVINTGGNGSNMEATFEIEVIFNAE